MRNVRNSMIIAVVGGMLASSAVGVAAQSGEVDPMAPAFVTGSITDGQTASTETRTAEEGYRRIEVVGGPDTWEASDSRLSGDVTYSGLWHRYPAPATMQVEAAARELVNSGGRWVGQATAIATATIGGWDAIVFTGEGGYEGLTAYVVIDWNGDPGSFVGAIFPGDMPAFPEPVVRE